MIEAYEIGISLVLQDGVSDGIALIRRDLAALDRAIAATSQNLARLAAATPASIAAPVRLPATRNPPAPEPPVTEAASPPSPAPVVAPPLPAIRVSLPASQAVPQPPPPPRLRSHRRRLSRHHPLPRDRQRPSNPLRSQRHRFRFWRPRRKGPVRRQERPTRDSSRRPLSRPQYHGHHRLSVPTPCSHHPRQQSQPRPPLPPLPALVRPAMAALPSVSVARETLPPPGPSAPWSRRHPPTPGRRSGNPTQDLLRPCRDPQLRPPRHRRRPHPRRCGGRSHGRRPHSRRCGRRSRRRRLRPSHAKPRPRSPTPILWSRAVIRRHRPAAPRPASGPPLPRRRPPANTTPRLRHRFPSLAHSSRRPALLSSKPPSLPNPPPSPSSPSRETSSSTAPASAAG